MRLSSTLSVYIGRQFLWSFLAILGVFLLLIALLDVVELLRRVASKPEVTFFEVLTLSMLKLPHLSQKTFPFAVMFGAMAVFWRLTRSHELTVTRSAGVSAWQFLLPVLVLAFLVGVVQVTVVNPLAASMLSRFERIEATLVKGRQSTLAVSSQGLWLMQSGDGGRSVVHASRALQDENEVELREVIVFEYEGSDHFVGRIEAERAILEDGAWRLFEAWVLMPEAAPRFESELRLATDLTFDRIQESFAPPETMSFWNLPAFIDTLETSGFSALRHRLHFHVLLAAPLLMCAMVLIAATFTLRHARRGGVSFVIGAGVLTGFVVHFVSDVVYAIGMSDAIPVTLAAWTPSGVATLLGLAMLLHLEDG